MTAESLDYVRICESCPPSDGWGPSVTTETTLDGVPYAPFSKGDKLGRMADWTTEGKDRERGSRMQFQRNYRGNSVGVCEAQTRANSTQTSKRTARATPSPSMPPSPKTSLPSPSSATRAKTPKRDSAVAPSSTEAVVKDVADAGMPAAVGNSPREVVADVKQVVVTTVEVVEAVVAAGVALAGRIMTSLNVHAILASTCALTGTCWRRLTLTAWQS